MRRPIFLLAVKNYGHFAYWTLRLLESLPTVWSFRLLDTSPTFHFAYTRHFVYGTLRLRDISLTAQFAYNLDTSPTRLFAKFCTDFRVADWAKSANWSTFCSCWRPIIWLWCLDTFWLLSEALIPLWACPNNRRTGQ